MLYHFPWEEIHSNGGFQVSDNGRNIFEEGSLPCAVQGDLFKHPLVFNKNSSLFLDGNTLCSVFLGLCRVMVVFSRGRFI